MGKGLACILQTMLTRPGRNARVDDRVTAATGCRSYSPLEGRPAPAGTHTFFIADYLPAIKISDVVDQDIFTGAIH
jgi:hypothetical protein